MTDARRFLLDDISAMLDHDKTPDWLNGVNDGALFELWKDLVNHTNAIEDITK